MTLAGGVSFAASAPSAAVHLTLWTSRLFVEQQLREGLAVEALFHLGSFIAPALAAAVVASGAVGVLTAGFEVHTEHLKPRWDRVDPLAGFKKLFSPSRLLEPARALLVLGLFVILTWVGAEAQLAQLLGAVRMPGHAALTFALDLVLGLALRLSGALLAVGVMDQLIERWQHHKRLRMSREEIKREHKESEGDPQQKAQRKSLHRQLSSGGASRGVKSATAVVVNPTHIAVALRYAPDECDAPYLVAKGRENDALAIRREAKALEVPIIRDIPLARSLIHFDVGEQIPEELYRAAAAVLKVAMESSEATADSRRKS